jgi:hypothetical protein
MTKEIKLRNAEDVTQNYSLYIKQSDDNDTVWNNVIYLISEDKKRFPIKAKHIRCSNLLEACFEADTKCKEIPLPRIDSRSLRFFVLYMNWYEGVAPPVVLSSFKKKVYVDDFTCCFLQEFCHGSNQRLGKMVVDCNYLDLKHLLHACCDKLSSKLQGLQELPSEGRETVFKAENEELLPSKSIASFFKDKNMGVAAPPHPSEL